MHAPQTDAYLYLPLLVVVDVMTPPKSFILTIWKLEKHQWTLRTANLLSRIIHFDKEVVVVGKILLILLLLLKWCRGGP